MPKKTTQDDDGATGVAPSLYPGQPTFTYIPKDGDDPIVFPAHSLIRGEVGGVTYLEFLWQMDEDDLSDADQIFAYTAVDNRPKFLESLGMVQSEAVAEAAEGKEDAVPDTQMHAQARLPTSGDLISIAALSALDTLQAFVDQVLRRPKAPFHVI